MMNRIGIVVTTASLTFVVGIVGGLLIGAPRAQNHLPLDSRQPVRTPSPDVDGTGRPADATKSGTATNPPKSPTSPSTSREEIERIARELWNLVVPPKTEGPGLSTSPNRSPNRRALLRKLRPEMAEFFIRKFRESEGSKDSSQQLAMEMAIACGGPRAVDFVEELTRIEVDRNTSFRFRYAVSMALSNGHLGPRPREFPVSDALMGQTRLLLGSGEMEDRRLAVAILGHVEASQSVPTLLSMTRADPNPYVRQAAIRELGRLGDAGTLAMLRSSRDTLAAEMYKLELELQQPGRSINVPVVAHAKSTHTLAIDDAIEELEERLQRN